MPPKPNTTKGTSSSQSNGSNGSTCSNSSTGILSAGSRAASLASMAADGEFEFIIHAIEQYLSILTQLIVSIYYS